MDNVFVINIDECCICLDDLCIDNILLKCCKKFLHSRCLFKIFVFNITIDNTIINCPLCRVNMRLKDVFNIETVLNLFNNQSNILKSRYCSKVKDVLISEYEVDVYSHKIYIDYLSSSILVKKRYFLEIQILDFLKFLKKFIGLLVLFAIILVFVMNIVYIHV